MRWVNRGLNSSPRARPLVVQHSFGEPGSGGPVGALERLLDSELGSHFDFVRMHQSEAAGGINGPLLLRWTRMLKELQPDLVHVRGLGNEGFHAAVAARLAGCPRILVSIHGSARDLQHAKHPLRRRIVADALEPATLRMATHLVPVCEAMSGRTFLDPARAKILAVVPNGVEIPNTLPAADRSLLRAELGIPGGRVALVSVGRLSVEKGHIELARALDACGQEVLTRTALVLVGDGPDRESVLAAYRAVPGLMVRELGRRRDVIRVLQASDIFVFPTLHENLSNALLEAMSVGLPVIATSVGGNVEVLRKGGGVLVGPHHDTDLSAALARMVHDAEWRASLGARAREVVAESYTLDQMAAAWGTVYNRALGGARDL